MFAATRRWFRRNRTNIFIGAGVVGATFLAGQYVVGKIQEARRRINDERISKENLRRRFEQNQEDCTYTVLALLPTVRDEIISALPVEQITEQLQQERQERLRRLGQSEAASSELPSGPPSVTDRDDASLKSSGFVHTSQITLEGPTPTLRPKRSKSQLWQDMKINSIARAFTLIYTLSLLTLLTRIQLNLLGRRTYLSSVVALASPPPATTASTISMENRDDDNYDDIFGNDFETNRKYLTFSWWLLHRGSKQILERVTAAVKDVFGAVNIREDMTLERLASLVLEVRRKVEGATEDERRAMKWLQYLLPPQDQEHFVIRQSGMSDGEDSQAEDTAEVDDAAINDDELTLPLRRLLDETSDLIDSPSFSHVLTHCLDAAFSHLVDFKIAVEAFKATAPPSLGEELPRVTEILDTKCKLANVLPVFCKQAHVITVSSGELDALAGVAAQEPLGNEYLAVIDRVPEVGAFAAVIFSSNFEYESPGPETQPAQQPSSSPTAKANAESIVSDSTAMSAMVEDADPEPGVESFIDASADATAPTAPSEPGVESFIDTGADVITSAAPSEPGVESFIDTSEDIAPPAAHTDPAVESFIDTSEDIAPPAAPTDSAVERFIDTSEDIAPPAAPTDSAVESFIDRGEDVVPLAAPADVATSAALGVDVPSVPLTESAPSGPDAPTSASLEAAWVQATGEGVGDEEATAWDRSDEPAGPVEFDNETVTKEEDGDEKGEAS